MFYDGQTVHNEQILPNGSLTKRPRRNLVVPRHIRNYATAATNDPSKIRNIALVAHIDSGKTTLTESILLTSKYLSAAGSVDTGSTTTDFLPAERERGITIQSASIPVKWKDWTFNLIDTPGHADFGMEVESASRVVDGAVVLIDSVEGVEAQTKGVWKQLDRYKVPTRLMFLNKLDRPGASFKSSLLSLMTHRLHPKPMALILPIASFNPDDYQRAEPGIEGLVDLVKWEVWKWDGQEGPTRHPLPESQESILTSGIFPELHPIAPHLIPARAALLENLAMFAELLMEQLLEANSAETGYTDIKATAILPHLRKATISNEILPVLCGSATKNIGTDLVLDYVGELLASPKDVSIDLSPVDKPLLMLAWKVAWDKRKGWMTFVRIYSGTLNKQTVIVNKTRGQKERVSKLLLLYASNAEEVDSLSFGSVGVVLGLKFTRTGDTLVSSRGSAESSLPDIIPPPAVMSASIIPQSHSDLGPVQEALEALSRTDPSVRHEAQEGQLLVHGLGALHLEIVEDRLRNEWNARFEVGQRRVSYREGVGSEVQASFNTWSTEIGGKKVDVMIDLEVHPAQEDEPGDPMWDGNIVLGADGEPLPSPDSFPNPDSPPAFVARGLFNALCSSLHTSLALSRVHIKVKGFSERNDVPPSVLASAAAFLLRRRLREAGPGPVMEPYMNLKVSVTEETLGKVVKDLTEHGGEVLDLGSNTATGGLDSDSIEAYQEDGVYVPPEWLSPSSAPGKFSGKGGPSLRRSVYAVVPLSRMLDYSTRLRALSGAGFREVSSARRLEILKEIGRA
ncbi:P-loop containing nucleoside triphosphate hydrolase protein [Thelephora ganbajun]|uniref:P-loop containing nucleoside triphosphate hydrolase protein n=1 Tax=Thelephora ganbajun TaxID=370292 RepID=A0ACB6Z8I5_THEGA|nr:P-loop containing nucleoside triphosphate hydrolase protein [Thelephora ganbajun]